MVEKGEKYIHEKDKDNIPKTARVNVVLGRGKVIHKERGRFNSKKDKLNNPNKNLISVLQAVEVEGDGMVAIPRGGNVNNERRWETLTMKKNTCQYQEQMKIVFIQISITKVMVVDSTQAEFNHIKIHPKTVMNTLLQTNSIQNIMD